MKNRKIMKTVMLLAISVIMLASAFGCAASTTDSTKPCYTVVTEATYPPFDTVDESGNIIGFDMDLMSAIAEDQGFDVEFKDMAFDSLIPAVEAGNADIIAAGMWADDPERMEKIDFIIYWTSGGVLMCRTDDDRISDLDSLTSDMKVASQIGSNYADDLQTLASEGKIAEAVIMDGFDTCILQLTNGDVDAVYTGYEIALAYSNASDGKLKICSDIQLPENLGIGVKKGNEELYNKIAAGFANIKDNGKFEEICKKWFTTDTVE